MPNCSWCLWPVDRYTLEMSKSIELSVQVAMFFQSSLPRWWRKYWYWWWMTRNQDDVEWSPEHWLLGNFWHNSTPGWSRLEDRGNQCISQIYEIQMWCFYWACTYLRGHWPKKVCVGISWKEKITKHLFGTLSLTSSHHGRRSSSEMRIYSDH